ncbi:hypothetical protein FOL47_000219 [Perkinsus chesapeaki]|uniref:Reverse transcriptase domain-containing protein n=1 Tax=Perkinsus chesapeaki TaxID=330153 RepID=A0A7J6KYS9_PERCH|nr:hypothetical protein FOL47_000219 [Perkinsus chesapeaki]
MSVVDTLPADIEVDTSDTPICSTADKSPLKLLGSTILPFTICGNTISNKFYVTVQPLAHPMIIGQDIMAKTNLTLRFSKPESQLRGNDNMSVSSVKDPGDWKKLPEGWMVNDVIMSNDKLHIVSAKSCTPGSCPPYRFYVGVNPAIIKDSSRAEKMGALKPHKNLSEAPPEALEAGRRCFEQWRSEGRLVSTDVHSAISITNWYMVGGDSRRYRPVFPFIHLNRNLRSALGNEPFPQALIATLVDKSRCFSHCTVNDLSDAYMHLWLLPSNWPMFTVNVTPLSDTVDLCEFHCLPYGPSHCPRLLETCLQWLLKKYMSDTESSEIKSYMDDIALFSNYPDLTAEARLAKVCQNHDLILKASKRQEITDGDSKMLGQQYTDNGENMTLCPSKLAQFKARSPQKESSYADLLSSLGSLDESTVIPAWPAALKHAAQGLVARERSATGSPWSGHCSHELRDLVKRWHSMVSELPKEAFILHRCFDFDAPLHVYTDAAKYAGGYLLRQNGHDLLQRVHIHSSADAQLPIVCLEARILYRAFASVHHLEEVVEQTFRAGRPASSSSKDAKPILMKYMAMTNVLYDPEDFNRRIFIERVPGDRNPADALTRHDLLRQFVSFASSTSLEVCSASNEVPILNTQRPFGEDDALSLGVTSCSIQVTDTQKVYGSSTTLPSTSTVRNHQQNDATIKSLTENLLRCQSLPEAVNSSYSHVWHTLLLRDGLLSRQIPADYGSNISDVVVVPTTHTRGRCAALLP